MSTKQRLDDLEQEKSDLEAKMIQEEISQPMLSREQVLFWLHRFRGIDKENIIHRQQLIDCFVNAIYLYDDKILLTFNYKDGTKQITMEDVNGSDLGDLAAPVAVFIGCENGQSEKLNRIRME